MAAKRSPEAWQPSRRLRHKTASGATVLLKAGDEAEAQVDALVQVIANSKQHALDAASTRLGAWAAGTDEKVIHRGGHVRRTAMNAFEQRKAEPNPVFREELLHGLIEECLKLDERCAMGCASLKLLGASFVNTVVAMRRDLKAQKEEQVQCHDCRLWWPTMQTRCAACDATLALPQCEGVHQELSSKILRPGTGIDRVSKRQRARCA